MIWVLLCGREQAPFFSLFSFVCFFREAVRHAVDCGRLMSDNSQRRCELGMGSNRFGTGGGSESCSNERRVGSQRYVRYYFSEGSRFVVSWSRTGFVSYLIMQRATLLITSPAFSSPELFLGGWSGRLQVGSPQAGRAWPRCAAMEDPWNTGGRAGAEPIVVRVRAADH